MSVGNTRTQRFRGFGGFTNCKEGATAIEYAVIAAFLSVAIVVSVQNLGTSVRDDLFMSVQNAFAAYQAVPADQPVLAATPPSDPIITGSTGHK